MQIGNCYNSSEAIYHLLGGKSAGWTPMYMNTRPTGKHWFLAHRSGLVLDVTRKQFHRIKPDYSRGKGKGFMTKTPSKKARALMEQLVWQDVKG